MHVLNLYIAMCGVSIEHLHLRRLDTFSPLLMILVEIFGFFSLNTNMRLALV
ncbi:hypothetical protein HanXRQr2_Chr16g0770791 [Helianthus annuus]|uniref:Uncharacterized protein n=1 Tax=Helianthus annuus TaxID=4232 RepID=A0A9K3DX41_HELAN|nr:hypothetical protein HanXRQr2_Chr16g0770791 [Helianthus annuus]KAJ0823031.1 hypothetical protein HanPSC8_Chr16g0738901 [Helianthus annuus]